MAQVTVAQEATVLAAFAAIFQNNLVSADIATWRKFDGEMTDRNGLTVVEQVSPDYSTTFNDAQVADLSGGVQDSVFGSEQYRLRNNIGVSMGWDDFIKIRDVETARESQALMRAAMRLATDIDAYIVRYIANAGNNWLGDGSSTVATYDDVASGYTRLMEEGCEETDLRAVLSHADKQALGSDVVTDNASLADIGSGVYRNGFTGSVAGIPTMFTQQLPSLTVGTRNTVSALTAGTADSATAYEDVAISPAPGQFKTQILNMDIGAGSETLVDGDTFTIAGVFAYDNRAKKALDHLQQFRVVGNYTAVGGVVAPRVFPAIITSGPYQTVSNAAANTAAVTFLGAPSAVLKPRFICNKSSVIINTRDLAMPATGMGSRRALTKIPLSVRMWKDSKFETGEHRVRFDVALEANIAANGRPKIVRINGS